MENWSKHEVIGALAYSWSVTCICSKTLVNTLDSTQQRANNDAGTSFIFPEILLGYIAMPKEQSLSHKWHIMIKHT